MGPRLFSRGKAEMLGKVVEVMYRFNGAATVQSRKGRESAWELFIGALLQWGRDCSVAERSLGPITRLGSHALQWGRDCSVAESGGVLASAP